mgnify:CR=1 FL=1|tara:strand:- start:22 stop:372 length:351 start_codon:yes stop_codon:yes gene_type:complete
MPNDYKLIGYDATNITRRVIGQSDTAKVPGNLTVEGNLVVNGTQRELKEANLTSQIDGSNYDFTMPEAFKSGSLRVYWNGLRQITGVSITVLSSTEFQTSFTPGDGDYLIADYYPA